MMQCFVYSTNIMEALKVREHVDNWNDDRMGELATDVKAGFARVEAQMKEGFSRVDEEMRGGFARVEGQIKGVEDRSGARMDRLEDRQEKLQYWIWGIGGTLVVSVIAGVIAHFA